MKKNKISTMILFLFFSLKNITAYAATGYIPEYFICQRLASIMKVLILLIITLTFVVIMKKKINNKIILKTAIILSILSILALILVAFVWVINFIKLESIRGNI